jgi:CRISPR-associated protein Cpf1
VSEFYRSVESQGYKIDYVKIDWDQVNLLVKKGKIYLFEILNKDFSPYSTGTKNLHTLLFMELLKPENSQNLKLLGGAEIFYRDASMESKTRKITNKNIISKQRYTKESILRNPCCYNRKTAISWPCLAYGSLR